MTGVTARRIESALVVGGAGFLGQWVVHELVEQGARVTSLDRDPRGRLDGSGAVSVQGDVDGADRVLGELLQGDPPDTVFTLVGTGSVPRSLDHPRGDLDSNAGSVLAVLEALRPLPARPVLVQLSSAAVYGDGRVMPMGEDHPLQPVSPYGVSKLAAESYVRLYHRLHGQPALSLRPFSLYGPGQRKLIVYDLMRRLLDGERPLVVRGDPAVTRDFVFVRDAARAAVRLAAVAPARGEAYNVCSGRGTSLGELVGRIVDAIAPGTDFSFDGTLRAGDPRRWEGDAARSAALGAVCDTELTAGVQDTARWCRAEHTARGGTGATQGPPGR